MSMRRSVCSIRVSQSLATELGRRQGKGRKWGQGKHGSQAPSPMEVVSWMFAMDGQAWAENLKIIIIVIVISKNPATIGA